MKNQALADLFSCIHALAHFTTAVAVSVKAVMVGFLLSDGVDCADHQRDITGKLVELNVHRHSRLISLKPWYRRSGLSGENSDQPTPGARHSKNHLRFPQGGSR